MTANNETLERIKNEVAMELYGRSWNESESWEHNMWPIVCERFAQEQVLWNKEILSSIGNLLAVMHGDGGHYRQKYGTLRAIRDAQELLFKKWITIDQAKDLIVDSLKEAAENARVSVMDTGLTQYTSDFIYIPGTKHGKVRVDKSSIANEKNIKLI